MLEVHLTAVRVDLQSQNPVVLLQERKGDRRSLPIFIHATEANAIALALQHIEVSRPMTHDLMKDLIEGLGAHLVRVVVTELRDQTYYAELHLQVADRLITISSRPSDAIALAVRTEAPLFVEDELMNSAGLVILSEDDDEVLEAQAVPEELVGEFREFLDNISPEDFSS
jgi:bifunctional DNase/RNase